MALVQLSERAILDYLMGNLVGQVNGAITAPAAGTAAITVMGSAGSGSMDITATSGQVFLLGTPANAIGSATLAPNNYTNLDVVTASSGSTGTSLHITSQTIGKSRVVGDAIFLLGPQTALSPAYFNNTWYFGLSSVAYADATTAATYITAAVGGTTLGEPTSVGGYVRTPMINNAANFTAASGGGATPGSKTNGVAIGFAASSAAWSTGTDTIKSGFIADSPTINGGVVLAAGAVSPTTDIVNGSGITVSIGIGAFTFTLR